ncbi:MAG: methyltransferase domain-containing protein [Alphaproteobacteria bacterium]
MISRLLAPMGWVLVRRKDWARLRDAAQTAHYVLHRYEDGSGTFDYESYRRVQDEGNRAKIDKVFVKEENIAFLADYLKRRLGRVDFGLCHGTRRGAEQAWFRQYLGEGAEVLGTEIADSATDFPQTVQWDFHDVKDAWVGAADFVYSNSFDHAYDPEKALNAWVRSLKPGGMCLIEHTKAHRPDKTSRRDPFGARLEDMPYLVLSWGKGAYAVTEILAAPVGRSRSSGTAVLVVEPRAPAPRRVAQTSVEGSA